MKINLDSVKPNYGVFVKGTKNFLDSRNSEDIKFELRKSKTDSNSIILQVSLENRCKKGIFVNSIMVADFLLHGNFPEKVLENSWTQSGFSGYRDGIVPTKKKKIFLLRDQNPFSFKEDFGYLGNSLISEWYTQLVKGDDSLVIGATTTKDQFSQVFLRKEKYGTRVRVTCQLDGLELKPGKIFKSEEIVFISGKQETLGLFADLIKNRNRIHLARPIRGLCCAYYYQGNYVDEKYILEQLNAIDKFPQRLALDLIQIDGLPTPWGDWLETLERLFPRGLDFIVAEINKRGLKAGFWIAPFVASPTSMIFQNHPEWFLKNNNGKYFEARFTSPLDFLPFLSFRALDPTHPEVQKHLTNVIKKLISYGFKYIKTDFTYPVCFTTNFYKQMTRAQVLRLGFEIIKKATGKDVLIQSGITQLSPLIGLIDYCRVGLDALNPFVCGVPVIRSWVNNYMLKENLRNCDARNFWHNKIWVNDPDCIVFRSGTGVSQNLIKRQKAYAHRNKTSLWTGDNLALLKHLEKIELAKFMKKK